jgi:hypothetical protein
MAKIIALVITPFHKDVAKAMDVAANVIDKANGVLGARLKALLASKYGVNAPSYEQFRSDRAALASIAKDAGMASDQYYRKAYNAAIVASFSALPVSQSAASIKARAKALAAGKGKGQGKKGKAGAVKGETAARRPATAETIEQYVARVDPWKVLAICVRILESDESTKTQALAIKAIIAPKDVAKKEPALKAA